VRQPDHEQAFSNFEGTIPVGNFGAGTIQKEAEGVVDILKVETTKQGMKIMHLRFHGDLEGDYMLVQTPRHEAKDWLWIAKHGPEPLEEYPKSKFLLKQREQLQEIERRCAGRCIAEVKADGHFENIYVKPHGLRLASHRLGKHTGIPIEHSDKLPHLRDTIVSGHEGSVFHGELYIKGQSAAITGGVLNSKPIRARLEQETRGVVQVKLHDCVMWKGKSVKHLPYEDRRALMLEFAEEADSPHIHVIRGTRTNFDAFYERVTTGKEFRYRNVPQDGVVVKSLDGSYQSESWPKIKPDDAMDLEVVGYQEEVSIAGVPKGRLGALTVLTSEGKSIQVSGFTDREKDWIWAHKDDVIGDVAKVRFHKRLGSPYTGPRWDGFHPDKSEVGALMALELENS